MREEIFEQPAVLARLLEQQGEAIDRVADAIRRRGVEFVFLAARGTSDHAGVYAQYLWGAHNRLAVALAAPSLFSLYGSVPRLERALVVGISQSGQSPDVAEVITEGRRQGALTLALTNAVDSPLAQGAEFAVNLSAGVEKAVAATKTYTAELMAVAALSVALGGSPDERAALARVPEAAAEALGQEETARQIAAADREQAH
ncbi:MAG TPA: SIS domain-containing protein, partial [Anaerolineaceae bacterium]|nr:SIS domain-containing protein [Anaerolineaceae bacterium]